MRFFNFGYEKKMPIGKMILLTGIVAASSTAFADNAKFERSSSPLERSSDSYLNETRPEAKKATTKIKERPHLPACDNVNGKLECRGTNPTVRSLKFPQPFEDNFTK